MIDRIGKSAGDIWKALEAWKYVEGKNEGMTITQLKNRTNLPTDLLHLGLGWLAREDKIQFSKVGKSIKVSLK